MIIKTISACDRNNYGDLLFPIIIKKLLDKKGISYGFDNYGIIKSDLTYFGAFKTKSIGMLVNELRVGTSIPIKLIIAGGEVLGGGWLNILRFLYPFWNKIHKIDSIRYRLINYRVLEKIYNLLYRGKYPFVFNKLVGYSNVEIFYNSVGALGVSKLLTESEIEHYFKTVKYIAVRDKYSLQKFKEKNIPAILVPDSALVMSDVFENELKSVNSPQLEILSGQEYIVVQIGKHKGPNDLKKFCRNLEHYSSKRNLKVILCPIGVALDHEDESILKAMIEIENSFVYFSPKNVFEIMSLIQGAKLFAGSSLHGIITAQSFGVPFLAFHQKIKKLEIYVSTWFDNPGKYMANYSEINKMDDLLEGFDFDAYLKQTEIQKAEVYNSLNFILGNNG